MKSTITSILVAVFLIGGALYLGNKGNSGAGSNTPSRSNVSIVNGKQIIEIDAKGGYSPRVTEAQAGIPTVIKMNTRGTFDCSSALVIRELNYQTNLPPSGTTEIEVPPQEAGSTFDGLCAMGMYNFRVNFN